MFMKNVFYVFLAGFLLITACTDPAEEKQLPQDTATDSLGAEQVDTLVTAETIQLFDQSGFSGFAKSQTEGFDWSKFKLVNVWKEDSLLVSAFNPSKEYFRSYGKFVKYSPDSTKFIDLDSYNIDITNKQGKYSGEEMGPDTEVNLVDIRNKEKTRLVFVGPSGSVEDGGWLDDETVVLIGIQENAAANSKTAVLWKYHLPTETFFLYEMQDPSSAEKIMNKWRAQRLKGVSMK